MKFSLVAIAAVIGSAQAFRKVTMSVSDGSFSTIDEALDPTLTLSGDTENGDVRVDYGLETSVKPTADIAALPKKGFVNLIYTKGDDLLVDVATAKDMRSGETTVVAGVFNAEKITGVYAEASSSGGSLEVDSVTGITKLPIEEGSLSVTGTYVPDGDPTVSLAYSTGDGNTDLDVKLTSGDSGLDSEATLTHRMDNTGITVAYNEDPSIVVEHSIDDLDIKVTASASDQEVTLSKTFGDNTISPTIKRSGDISVAWERDLGDDNSFTATVVPDDSINVEWKDDNWTANINAGLSGVEIGDLSVSAKRDINF